MAADVTLDHELALVLQTALFSGSAGWQLKSRLGRPIDRTLADLGRLLFFDKILSKVTTKSWVGTTPPPAGRPRTQAKERVGRNTLFLIVRR